MMADDPFLDQVKKNLRVSTTDDGINQEIIDLISAARNDLYVDQSVDKTIVYGSSPLIKQAIILYCRARFGLNNQDSEKYWSSYQELASELSLKSQYSLTKLEDSDGV
ncbi:head-tail connector protein [Oenococcus alcoholitolerans]|uniref:head-tail connector protein n=1 Tax=Oenococcus alcoholitolerans TaxID=931074 RepID=UPI003F70D5F0